MLIYHTLSKKTIKTGSPTTTYRYCMISTRTRTGSQLSYRSRKTTSPWILLSQDQPARQHKKGAPATRAEKGDHDVLRKSTKRLAIFVHGSHGMGRIQRLQLAELDLLEVAPPNRTSSKIFRKKPSAEE